MVREKGHQRVFGVSVHKERQKLQDKGLKKRLSANETPVDLLDPELRPLIKVNKPSRSSLTYERME